jgi:hypothetical protein
MAAVLWVVAVVPAAMDFWLVAGAVTLTGDGIVASVRCGRQSPT